MRIALLTGAGLSTGAGIPDFRGPQGLWTQDPRAERMSTLSWYLGDEDVRRLAWRSRAESPVWDSAPTRAHLAIAQAAQRGTVSGVVTQNTDGLHQLAGTPAHLVRELHGSMRTWRCEDCRATGPMAEMIERVRAGEADPHCARCGGIVRGTTILFEEALDPQVVTDAIDIVQACDVLIAAGTSLTVTPAADLFPIALEAGARGIIANAEPTPYDRASERVERGDLEEVIPRLLAEL
ncbi:Sir2 family NAD-dependent protein deacetylase [Brevibacterium sp. BRM-1]|uniref:SIR2 family NAD-dependent protein deacylase n=1 Tax=Brevibacterium sp. BRM-1 TaxID=2999062 RepID=UPI00227DBBA3|nr:Sir2 family NAD-dependent protein deacetylase [Brevibacterium sp. BRM-1]WAL41166.1 Sir2 family NAD-dependent protein deacetylase [Brevibacterium sp. BRM-1]